MDIFIIAPLGVCAAAARFFSAPVSPSLMMRDAELPTFSQRGLCRPMMRIQ
jgi:hypothetical protein